jgi:hypothetical protein
VDAKAKQYLIANCEELNGRQLRNSKFVIDCEAKVNVFKAPKSLRNIRPAHTDSSVCTALHNAVSIAEVQERRNQQQHIHDFIRVERHHVVSAIGRSTSLGKYARVMEGKDEFTRARRRGDYHVENITNKY